MLEIRNWPITDDSNEDDRRVAREILGGSNVSTASQGKLVVVVSFKRQLRRTNTF